MAACTPPPVAPRVLLRSVASTTVGAGHLKRDMALALALRALGAEVGFALPELVPPFDGWLREAGLPAVAVGTGLAPEVDARVCLATWPAADWIVVDDYALDARWHAAAGRGDARIAVIDDLADRPLDAALVIDTNEGLDAAARYAAVLRGPARLLAGCRYALLDAIYAETPRTDLQEPVRSLGVFMGGSDARGVSAAVVGAVRRAFNGPIEVVATSAHARLDALRALAAADPGLRLSLDLPHLAGFHARHGLQIGAGGSANWERCCLGVPTLAVPLAANQLAVLPALAASGAVALWDGDPLADPAGLAFAIAALLADPARRAAIAAAGRRLVDGQGAARVALAMLADRLALRPATAADCDRMLQWRNDPATRAVSADAREIDPAAHRAWYAAALTSPTRRLWIGRVGPRPVGVLRFDVDPSATAARVSIFLDPMLVGLGLGTPLLAQGEAALRHQRPTLRRLEAEVLPDNRASQALFRRAGYAGDGRLLTKPLDATP
jgi:UDP-2,4-diacetamido-2,4,6-trideoxy-beta-L-altropyranose hydrolase